MEIDPDIPRKITAEACGDEADLTLLLDEQWMQETEVSYLIQEMAGRWHVSMIFISIHEPLKIVVRRIDHYHSKKKAEQFAQIFQRGIRKDPRGTLKRKQDDYHICLN
ncbi:MAG: hypothetical protein AAF206_14180 [Bacteroidota bacterium]